MILGVLLDNVGTPAGDASARDVATLLARVRRAVEDQFGVDLHLEVHLVGEFTAECPA